MSELLREYLPILVFIIVAAGLSGIMVIASLILARQKPDSEKLSPYECGFEAFDDARRQFEILAVQAPNNLDVLYALALLYLQAGRLDDAEAYFQRLASRDDRGDNARYYLGRIAEERKD